MKSARYIIVIIICLAIASVSYLYIPKSIGSSSDYQWGQKFKELFSNNNAETVMLINGEPVTQKQLKSKMCFLEAQQLDASEEAARQILIKQIVLWQEAERRGLTVSLKEAESFAETMKKDLLDNPEIPGAKETLDFIASTGQTLDEYFQEAIPDYQKALMIAKLRSEIARETNEQYPSLSQQDLEIKQQEAFSSLEKKLIEEAQVINKA